MADARFEDAAERPLRLRAETPEDLAVLSALVQDAVGRVGDIAWARKHRRLALLLNRFRWEDRERAERAGRPFERVRATLVIEGALSVRASGVLPQEKETVISLLSLVWEPGEDGTGTVRLILAGDGELAVSAETLDVTLTDVTRPYAAPSGLAPSHEG
jgi:hypothetical protein